MKCKRNSFDHHTSITKLNNHVHNVQIAYTHLLEIILLRFKMYHFNNCPFRFFLFLCLCIFSLHPNPLAPISFLFHSEHSLENVYMMFCAHTNNNEYNHVKADTNRSRACTAFNTSIHTHTWQQKLRKT